MGTALAREGETFTGYQEFEVITCTCGIPFAVPARYRRQLRETRETFYCPNGCRLSYTQSESERLRKQLESKQRELESVRSTSRFYQGQAETQKRRAAAHAGVSKRRKKQLDRVAHGVCPCCNRSFVNLAAHMTDEHPEFRDA